MTVKTFIDRPLFSIVISVFIVALGVIALISLPVERYPDIAPPAINVWASYPGASAETVQKSVVTPLEEAINGVEGMTYMKSSASNGSGSVTVFFEQGANADMAAVNVQNRVIQAQGQLPAEVLQIGVSTEKQQPGQLRIIALESPGGTYDENFLSNYFYNNLRPAILRINGVGKVEVWGAQYALRIWLKPDVMPRHNLMPSDISAVLAEQNIEVSVGALGENSDNVFQYSLRYTGRKTEISEFENLVIASLPTGEELRLKDVADIELGQSDYAFTNRINGHPGVMGAVHQVAGSNATKINLEIDKLIHEVEQSLSKDIKIVTFDNTNDFLFASIREVVVTLIIAILLVLVVVLFFLQDFRATLVPAVGIVVSLIGTFAFMKVAGFSVNLLTLFALVLVIGTVVDDSIVVVEAVKARQSRDVPWRISTIADPKYLQIGFQRLVKTLHRHGAVVPPSQMGGGYRYCCRHCVDGGVVQGGADGGRALGGYGYSFRGDQEREAESFAMEPGMIEGYGGGGGFEFSVQDRNGMDVKTLKEITDHFVEKLQERPEIGDIYSNYDVNYPQYRVDVDVSRCKKAGVSPSTVLNELGAYLGGDYISNFNKYGKVYQVTAQLHPSDRTRPESLDQLFVRSEDGNMLPISQFITLTKEYMPQTLSSHNMFRCIDVSGNVAQGGSTGSAIKAIQEVAAKELPVGYSVEFSGITREESRTGNCVAIIFIISALFIYLVMVGLYESLFIPLVVLLSVPFGLAGSLLFAKMFGVENNIYMQIGLIMLVGLLAKTAILITEYASQGRQKGLSIVKAALRSAKERLRPILMTSLTMIFGMLPLMFATGAGANGSRTIGVCVVGGMLFGTLGLLVTVPALFTIFQKVQEQFKPIERKEEKQ